jgi:hypothetical protein
MQPGLQFRGLNSGVEYPLCCSYGKYGVTVREKNLPKALEEMGFLAWEKHRKRLASALADSPEPVERYRDLVLITNVMNSQYELVTEQLEDTHKAIMDATSESDPRVAEAQELLDWARPWLVEFQSDFAQCETERDQLRKSLPADDRDRVGTEVQGPWEVITEDIKATLMARMEDLQAEVGSSATGNAANLKGGTLEDGKIGRPVKAMSKAMSGVAGCRLLVVCGARYRTGERRVSTRWRR